MIGGDVPARCLRWVARSSPSAAAPTTAPSTAATTAPTAEPAAVKIVLAHSYTDQQPQAACGAKVIADEVGAAGVG